MLLKWIFRQRHTTGSHLCHIPATVARDRQRFAQAKRTNALRRSRQLMSRGDRIECQPVFAESACQPFGQLLTPGV